MPARQRWIPKIPLRSKRGGDAVEHRGAVLRWGVDKKQELAEAQKKNTNRTRNYLGKIKRSQVTTLVDVTIWQRLNSENNRGLSTGEVSR